MYSFHKLFSFVLLLTMFYPAVFAKDTFAQAQQERIKYLPKDYHALVVGVGHYDKWPILPNASQDAREVAWLLEQGGFKVALLIDPTSKQLKETLSDLTYWIGQEENRSILFYYRGHGETQMLPDGTKLGWIIPRDCPLLRQDPKEFVKHAISTKAIETFSMQIRSKHVLMLFDSSFSGDEFALESPTLRIINQKIMQPSRQYIIAGRTGEQLPDRSMFKHFFIKGLQGKADMIKDGYVTGSELGVYLSQEIVRNTGGSQHPQYGKIKNPDLTHGDFVFQRISPELLAEPFVEPSPEPSPELSPTPSPKTFTEHLPETSRLFVNTDPQEAMVRILNIHPRFQQGIELKTGKYHIEISADGYVTRKQWVSVNTGEDKTLEVKLQKIETTITNSLGIKFVWIDPGRFEMGSRSKTQAAGDDETAHQVTISEGFYMQATEMTVGQFRKFIQDTGYKTEAEKSGGCWVMAKVGRWQKQKGTHWDKISSAETNDHPVACVSWNDVRAFIKWLSKKEGKSYDLPTEAQWEYACRAGTKSLFSNGDCLSTDHANFGSVGPFFEKCKSVFRKTRKTPLKVASLQANPWGLYDLHGNVAEWCRDWYGPYPSLPVKDPKGPASSTDRVIRGGHYFSEAQNCRSAARSSFLPHGSSAAIGFRLVMMP